MVRPSGGFKSDVVSEEWDRKHVNRFDSLQARRVKGPIYEVLLKELYEQNCQITAKYFACLILKEQRLRQGLIVSHGMYQVRKLLIAVVDNMKLAEQAWKLKTSAGLFTCLNLFFKTLALLTRYHTKFGWIVIELFEILVHNTEKFQANDSKSLEMKSRIFCLYGIYLCNTIRDCKKGIEYFNKSLDLCRGEYWTAKGLPNGEDFVSLHEFVAINLAKALRDHATKTFERGDVQEAMDLLNRSIFAFSEVHRIENVFLLVETHIHKIRFLIEIKSFKEAVRYINVAQRLATKHWGMQMIPLAAELYLLKGICVQNLDVNPLLAVDKYKRTLYLGKKHEIYEMEGEALYLLGKLYVDYNRNLPKALEYFTQSKNAFEKVQNAFKKQIATYAFADVEVKKHFRDFMALLKESESDFCSLFKLRKWKEQIEPFWDTEISPEPSAFDIDSLSHRTDTLDVAFSQHFLTKYVSVLKTIEEKNEELYEYTSVRENRRITRVLSMAKIFKGIECLAKSS